MKENAQKGVALVTTLIMLSIITLMTVAFLAMSRRERASMTVVKDIATAQQMADVAIDRAKAEMASRILSHSNLFAYDFLVSTNWVNPNGFESGNANLANVSYTNDNGALLRNESDLLRNLANLKFDPRPPVFYDTNPPAAPGASQTRDFRFWLDLNRNGQFEQSGLLPVTPVRRRSQFDVFVGDPEWVGVLENPDLPHSPDNQFVGRWAFLALPSGKSLDLNFIHNQAKRLESGGGNVDAFNRNQGVGSWEINLAAFLRELNTNIWDETSYQEFIPRELNADGDPILDQSSLGYAFDDAKDLLIYRYDIDPEDGKWGWQNLEGILEAFHNSVPTASPDVRENLVDDFSDGLSVELRQGEYGDDDEPSPSDLDEFPTGQPWSGSASTNSYKDPQELFKPNPWFNNPQGDPQRLFTSRLTRESGVVPAAVSQSQSSYDRYTFYRLLSQMGVDSAPANEGKIHLNYDNRADLDMVTNVGGDIVPLGARATDFQDWEAGAFFNLAADRILQEQFPGTGISITHIPLFPTNYYTATLHRSLQLAANIYEAGFHGDTNINNFGTSFEFPRVYQPLFGGYNTNFGGTNTQYVYIKGFQRLPDSTLLRNNNTVWRDLNLESDRVALQNSNNSSNIVFGIPLVIGARKGLPNFNEFTLQTIVTATRKLQLEKDRGLTQVVRTNQQHIFNVSNRVEMELWNSYTQAWNRRVSILATNVSSWVIRRDPNPDVEGDEEVIRSENFLVSQNNTAGNNELRLQPMEWSGTQDEDNPENQWVLPFNDMDDPLKNNFEMLPRSKYTQTPNPRNSFDANNVTWDRNFAIPRLDLIITNRMNCLIYDTDTGAIIDFVNLANIVRRINFNRALVGNTNSQGDLSDPASHWITTRRGGNTIDFPTEGIVNQVSVSLGIPEVSYWRDSGDSSQVPSKPDQIDGFRVWTGEFSPRYNPNFSPSRTELNSRTKQPGYTATRKLRDVMTFQANDPLVHYTRQDLIDPDTQQDPEIIEPPFLTEGLMNEGHSIGRLNQSYQPWGGNPNKSASGDRFESEPTVKDAAIANSDSWQFRTNKYENVGALGAVHRGSPWQTVYLKSNGGGNFAPLGLRGWIGYSGQRPLGFRLPMTNSLGNAITDRETGETNFVDRVFTSHPTNDWVLTDLFTTAYNDNAARGLLGVNQTNVAAWAGVLGGVKVLRDARVQDSGALLPDSEILIEPATEAFRQLINGTNSINAIRAGTNFFSGHFPTGGAVLAAPKLTLDSPYIDWSLFGSSLSNNLITDEVIEKIPRQIMSLVKRDQPVITIFAYGETLQPASPNAVYRGLGEFNGMVTNYTVSARFVVKEMVELDGDPNDPNGDLRLNTISRDVIYEE